MKLLQLLQSISNRLGLIRLVADETPEQPATTVGEIHTRSLTLAELTSEIRTQEVEALAEQPAEMSVSLDEVIKAAGIQTPSHGWNTPRLRSLLQTEQYQTMDRAAAQKAVLGVLVSENVPVHDLVNDAMGRDKALDAYEKFVCAKLDSREQARREQIKQMRAEILAVEDKIARIEAHAAVERSQLADWRQKKQQAEDDLVWTMSYLLDDPVITRDRAQ